jgi:KipI family sensor histidine kinase inhibitor
MTESRVLASGDTVLVLEFGDRIDWRISQRVNAVDQALRRAPPAGVVETVPTFRSLAVHYDPDQIGFEALADHLRAMAEDADESTAQTRLWRIPACYDAEFGPDLAEVGERAGMTPEQVIECHASRSYLVYMMGFLPGFPYMGDVAEPIALPRRETPRTRVPKGSVAVATEMTAVYTLESPGGWHILGRTPVRFFDLDNAQPALLAPGDKVVFEPVSREDYEAIRAQVSEGRYQLAPEEAAQ